MKGRDLSAACIKGVKKRYPGCWLINVIAASTAGTPDILVLVQGSLFGLEIKGDNDRVSPLQQVAMENIVAAGGHCCVVRKVQDAYSLIDSVCYPSVDDTQTL